MDWILLVHQLPPQPTSLRVRTWRKLQKLGAVAIKNSIYALPYNEKTHEDFQWLTEEIESAGGEATVFRAGSVEDNTDAEIVALFRSARENEYARLAGELESLARTLRHKGRSLRAPAAAFLRPEAELARLRAELERIGATDFFKAKNRAAVMSLYQSCHKLLHSSLRRGAGSGQHDSLAGVLDLSRYQGRRWVTRRHLHIDRLACAWLIKSFVDRRARFVFVGEGEPIRGGIPFDMFGAELGHHGGDCTFETMIKRFGLGADRALQSIGQIVHDIDLKDNKFSRLEAPGLDAVVSGLGQLVHDRKLVQQCGPIFDGMYLLLNENAGKRQKRTAKGRRAHRVGRTERRRPRR